MKPLRKNAFFCRLIGIETEFIKKILFFILSFKVNILNSGHLTFFITISKMFTTYT